jgi:hypothetical protein
MFAQPANAQPTWRQAGPLIDRYCNDCHRPGQVGPFDFTTYEEASAYAPEMIRYLSENKMPPWRVKPAPTLPTAEAWRWANSRALPNNAKETILAWARAGAPLGPGYTPKARHPQWNLGEPDLVLSQPAEHTVSGEKTVDIVSFTVSPESLGTTRARRFVRALDFRPSNRNLLHHAVLYQNNRPLAAWSMTDTGLALPRGVAWVLEKGQPLTIELHYFKRTLRPARDLTRVGLYLTSAAPEREAFLWEITKPTLRIPANAAAHWESTSYTVPQDPLLRQPNFQLHMILPVFQLLAQKIRLRFAPQSHWPLEIDGYEHHLMSSYVLTNPAAIPPRTRIEAEAMYNNSTANEFNPHRTPREVIFAENGLDETFRFWLTVSRPLGIR